MFTRCLAFRAESNGISLNGPYLFSFSYRWSNFLNTSELISEQKKKQLCKDDEPWSLQKHTMNAGETKPAWSFSSVSSMWGPLMINPAPTFIQLNADFNRQLSLPPVWPLLLRGEFSLCGPCQPCMEAWCQIIRRGDGNVPCFKIWSWLLWDQKYFIFHH